MRKAVAFALALGIGLALVLVMPEAGSARDVQECWDNHESCRSSALESDMPWWKAALALTVCDLALGRCIIMA